MASKKALVRPASPRLAEGIVTHIERRSIDYHLALKQWEGYVEAMEGSGWEIVEVPPVDGCPDGVFVEDTVVVFRNVAVLSRPGADSRRPEVSGVEQTVGSWVAPSTGSARRGLLTVATCSRSATRSTSVAADGPMPTACVS